MKKILLKFTDFFDSLNMIIKLLTTKVENIHNLLVLMQYEKHP